MTGYLLSDLTNNVIKFVQSFGLDVLAVVTNNNRINQNMFLHLIGSPQSFYFLNPLHLEEYILTIYNFVHIYKNIRKKLTN